MTCTVRREDGYAYVAVSDKGPGLPPERRDDPFSRFGFSKSGSGGSGLGLAFVEAVARRHGGEADYRDSEAGGACFIIRVPLAPDLDPA